MMAGRGGFSEWRIDLISFGLVALAAFLSSIAKGEEPSKTEQTAVALMQQAHNGRASWQNFPGFEANVRASVDGTTVSGTLQVSPTGELKLDLPGGESFEWVARSLKSIVGHRLAADEAIETVALADNQATHPLGRLLKSTLDSDKSLWRVQGDLMTEVHRFNEKTHFVISVADVARNAEGKHLPKNFSVTTWDNATGKIKSSRQVYNDWKRVGPFDLPAKLLATICGDDGSRRVEQIELLDLQLLPGSVKTSTR